MRKERVVVDSPGSVSVVEEEQEPPGEEQVLVRSIVSAISQGTETKFLKGKHTHGHGLFAGEDPIGQKGDFPFSLGYSTIGEVIEAGRNVREDILGKHVFAFVPHQSSFVSEPDDLVQLPVEEPDRYVFLANMETAVTLIMDGKPMIGEEVLVMGQGVVGLLLTGLLSRTDLSKIITVDPNEKRREMSIRMGADRSLSLQDLEPEICDWKGFDLIYEISGNPSALSTSIGYCGFSGRLVVGSYYGDQREPIAFGDGFHRKRIRMMSSQVSTLDPSLSGRWSRKRRTDLALGLLEKIEVERLITHRFDLGDVGKAYDLFESGKEGHLQVLFDHGKGDKHV